MGANLRCISLTCKLSFSLVKVSDMGERSMFSQQVVRAEFIIIILLHFFRSSLSFHQSSPTSLMKKGWYVVNLEIFSFLNNFTANVT